MEKEILRALRAFQENVSVQEYEYDKGDEYISMQDYSDETPPPHSTDFIEEARKEAERYTKIVSINGYYEHTLEVAFMQGAQFIINKLNELKSK